MLCRKVLKVKFLSLFLTYVFIVVVTTEELHICNDESITCPKGSFIKIERAFYGRFYSPTCKMDDSVPCGVDVTNEVERMCSGFKSCQLTIWSDVFNRKYLVEKDYNNCDDNKKSRISVTFSCLEYYDTPNNCLNSPISISTKKSGYLSNLASDKGLSKCPWLFNLSKFQNITFTLMDFGALIDSSAKSDHCQILIHVKSINFKTICRSNERKIKFSESGREVLLIMLPLSGNGSYVVQYEITTWCQPFIPPTFVKILHDRGSQIQVECLGGDKSEKIIHCHNGLWTPLTESNCSMDVATSAVFVHDKTSSQAVMIVIVIAIAFVISIIIIVVGLYCLQACPFQRKQATTYKQEENPSTQTYLSDKYSTNNNNLFMHQSQSMCELYPMLANPDRKLPLIQRDYATTLQMRQLAGYYPENTAWCPAHGPYYAADHGGFSTVDRRYNTSNIKRNMSSVTPIRQFSVESGRVSNGPSSPFYHELDQFTFKSISDSPAPANNAINIPCPTVPEKNDDSNANPA